MLVNIKLRRIRDNVYKKEIIVWSATVAYLSPFSESFNLSFAYIDMNITLSCC